MANRKLRKKGQAAALRPGRRKAVIAIGLALIFITAGSLLAAVIVGRSSPQAPASLLPSNPSREFIYGGGRLVASEEPVGPTISSISPSAKKVGDPNFTLTVHGSNFTSSSIIRFNGVDCLTTYGGSSQLTTTITTSQISTVVSPAVTVFNPSYGTSNSATFIVEFLDVDSTNPYYTYINKIAARRVTVGCGNGNYCLNSMVTRDQMAVFIERSLGVFNPPAPPTARFGDVPTTHWAFAFIEDFATRGITQGCSASPPLYCPGNTVAHEQMAAFIERALGVFNPPAPTQQRFFDVPPTNGFYRFIDDYARRGIWKGGAEDWTGHPEGGCFPGNFCPTKGVSRAQMAKILVKAFGW